MSESREKKARYNLRLQYIAEFDKWLDREPPRFLFWKWRKWKKERPVMDKFSAEVVDPWNRRMHD